MRPIPKSLFNFSASYSGGGLKRLEAYSREFDRTGGAFFLIHPKSSYLVDSFKNNTYYIISQSKISRLLKDGKYLSDILKKIGPIDFYYSYGIPIYSKIDAVAWLHISNVLPFAYKGVPMSIIDHIKMRYLGFIFKNNFKNANVISAESNYSLTLICEKDKDKGFKSINGGDDELSLAGEGEGGSYLPIAVVLGTYRYKKIEDSFRVFEELRSKDSPSLKMLIIGVEKFIPKYIIKNKNVIISGLLHRSEVINKLQYAKYYISTTCIENSYNAASEGIFFAKESFISDIGPHRELLSGLNYREVEMAGLTKKLLHIKKNDVFPINIKTWNQVVAEMMAKVKQLLPPNVSES